MDAPHTSDAVLPADTTDTSRVPTSEAAVDVPSALCPKDELAPVDLTTPLGAVESTAGTSEELFFNSTNRQQGGTREEGSGTSDTGGLASQRSKVDSTTSMDIETSRKLFLTRLSLEDTASSLEKLESFVGAYMDALEGHCSTSSIYSKAESTSVDPFKLSKRPLEDVAEDICNRIQALTARLEDCPEIAGVLTGTHNARGERKDTCTFLEPFQLLKRERSTAQSDVQSVQSMPNRAQDDQDGADDDEVVEEDPPTETTAAALSETGGFHSTFGPLVDTYQLESTSSMSPVSLQQGNSGAALYGNATFGPMLDTFSSQCLSVTFNDRVQGGGVAADQASRSFPVTDDSSAFNLPSGTFARVTGLKRPVPLGGVPPQPVSSLAQQDSLNSRSMQVDLQHSNPPPWLMRVPGRMAGFPSISSSGQANLSGVHSWQYVDPTCGTPVSLATFGEYIVSENSYGFDRHHMGTQTSPPTEALTASLKAREHTDSQITDAPSPTSLTLAPAPHMDEAQLRQYAQQLEAALTPEVVSSLRSSVLA